MTVTLGNAGAAMVRLIEIDRGHRLSQTLAFLADRQVNRRLWRRRRLSFRLARGAQGARGYFRRGEKPVGGPSNCCVSSDRRRQIATLSNRLAGFLPRPSPFG